VKLIATIIAVVLCCAIDLKAGKPSAENTIYDSDTNHIWNRLNGTLFVRTAPDGKQFGLDELDILYWFRTKNLLVEPSHQQAIMILDEFINTHGEKLIRDPLKRALLQRDLWELFDWSTKSSWNLEETRARRELQSRLAIAIRRLALTTNEIAALPDNYAQTETKNPPDLPEGLLQTNGDWVAAVDANNELTTPTHVASFDGHSIFCVMLHVPDGRQAAISYLDKLRLFEHVWIYRTNTSPFATTNEPREILTLNPDLPQFPANTEWALVRRMCVIDTDGNIQPTSLTESIQVRRYLAIAAPTYVTATNCNGYNVTATVLPQKLSEFQMNRRQNCELRAIGTNENGFSFVHFMGMGIDVFESSRRNSAHEPPASDSATLQSVTLKTCVDCHSAPGIFSVNSYTRFLSFSPTSQRPADLTPLDIKRETTETIYWKQRQFDWGLLQGLWNRDN
jgi:hypothetical protein